jgi:outer membrane murein-binding lipoprotein Lpp
MATSGETRNGEKRATGERDVLGRLADRGEEALQRLSEIPGGSKALKAFNDLRAGVDELGKKVRGIDALEARVAKLEKELASLRRATKPTAAKKPAARKRPA